MGSGPFPGPLWDVWAGAWQLPAYNAVTYEFFRVKLAEGMVATVVTFMLFQKGPPGGHIGGQAVVC